MTNYQKFFRLGNAAVIVLTFKVSIKKINIFSKVLTFTRATHGMRLSCNKHHENIRLMN